MRKNDCFFSNFYIIILFIFTDTYYFVIIGGPRAGNNANDASSLASLAHGIVIQVCCLHKKDYSCCLWQKKSASLASVERLVLSCLEEVLNLSKEDKRDYLT